MKNEVDSKKSVTVSLRIPKDVMDNLNDEANIDNISLNSLVNKILKRYMEWNKFEDKASLIPLSSVAVKELFEGLNKDQVIYLAKDVVKAIYDIILFMQGRVDINTLISWYLQRMKYCSEISEKRDNDENRNIIFKHELGENWSLYHKTIIESICRDILSMSVKVDITNSTIKFKIR